jgi:ABC-2 type transport system permease protein
METLQGTFAGMYTVWYRDVLSLLKDKPRIFGSIFMTVVMLVGMGFGFGSLIGRVGGGAASLGKAAASTGVPFVQFLFPALLGMVVLNMSLASTMSMVYDREFGFMRKILVAPVSRTSVALGKVAGGMTVAMIQALIVLVGAPLLGVHFTLGSVVLTVLVLMVMAAVITALGVLTASRQTSQQGFQFINMLVMMPLMLLTFGSFLPSFGSGAMDTAFRWASLLNPASYGIDALRQAMLGSAMPASLVLHPIGLDLLVLVALFVAFLVPGVKLFSKQD